jgi:hypothetical protein
MANRGDVITSGFVFVQIHSAIGGSREKRDRETHR